MRCFVSVLACLLLLFPTPTSAEELADVVQPLIDAHQGDVAVKIKDLATGETFEYHADKTMPTASLIKFPLMIASFQEFEEGNVTPDAMVELDEKDKVPGSGVLTSHFSGGAKRTWLPIS